MAPPTRPVRVGRFAAGALLATAVVLGALHLGLRGMLVAAARVQEQRQGLASLHALSELIRRTGDDTEKLRAAAAAFQKSEPAVRSVRVLLFSGAALEYSTRPEDTGERAAPRRLTKEEKTFYDLGNAKLRPAVETNREEGAARKDEVDVVRRPDGALVFSGPLALGSDPQIVGIVELTSDSRAAAQSPKWWTPLALALAALAIVAFIARASGSAAAPRAAHAAGLAGAVVVAAAVLAYYNSVGRTLDAALQATHEATSAHVRSLATRTVALSQALGLAEAPAPKPGLWDTDLLRQPIGVLDEDGNVIPQAPSGSILAAKPLSVALAAALFFALVALGGFHWLGRTLRDHRVAYAYIAPAMIGMALLVFFPFLYGISLSFTSSSLYNADKSLWSLFIGFENYRDILFDFDVVTKSAGGGFVINYTSFYWTLLFTIVWTVTNVTIGVTLGLALALALNIKGLAFRPVYRVLLILPWAVPNYITALIWKGMFHRQFGVINHLIALFGGEPQSWFDTPLKAFATALTTNGWLSFPFMMVVSLGALQSIPDELYEAAEVDGASRWQQFLAITLPALRPALVPAVILSVVWTFNMFNIIYLVTGGEPGGATEILVTQAYKHAFERYRYGYAAAYSTVIFLILLAYGVFQNRVSKATEA